MRIAIHHSDKSFSERWIEYCIENGIAYKIVDCYSTDIIKELEDCEVLMWHFHHNRIKDQIFAKQLLLSLETAGKKVFPNSNTAWHFDDKVGQKYLLEAIGAPLIPSYVFYSKDNANKWLKSAKYPIVFKLRSGAGSQNVRLVRNFRDAKKLVNKAFSRGFSRYSAISNLRDRIKKYKLRKTNKIDIIKGLIRLALPPKYSRLMPKERSYIYFQEFIPNNVFDIRVVIIDNKAFAIKRMVRKNDFRASGSGSIIHEKNEIDLRTLEIAFSVTRKIEAQCMTYDFVYNNNEPLIVEISFGFTQSGYDDCPGYWDDQLNWIPGKFNPQGWMIDLMLKEI